MRYKVGARDNVLPLGFPKYITIPANPEPPAKPYPLPNPYYLRIHAACARIAHLSGVDHYVNAFLQDLDNAYALASDGSSLPLLETALQIAVVRACTGV